MKFDSAKRLVGILMGLSVASCVIGLAAFEQGSREMATAALMAVVMLFLSVCVAFKWCRCPWCGQTIFRGLFSKKVCPACNRDLNTGKKIKGKGGKR